jgi:succinate dehydrogenase/fumarate reductase flavoprotein subunit
MFEKHTVLREFLAFSYGKINANEASLVNNQKREIAELISLANGLLVSAESAIAAFLKHESRKAG